MSAEAIAPQRFFQYTRKTGECQRIHGEPIPTVLITGASGFIGSHTAEEFIARGFHVRCLLRPSRTHLRWLEGLPVEAVRADLSIASQLARHLQGVDFVVHVAGLTKARTRREYFAGNVSPTRALLEAARTAGSVRKFVFLSSLTAVGPSATGEPLTEEAPCRPITTYGRSKLEAEQQVRHHAGTMPYVILRPPAVFGPRDPDILELFKWVKHGIRPVIGFSNKTISLVYAPELARAIAEATISTSADGRTYFVSDPAIFTLSSLLEYLATLGRRRTVSIRFPRGLIYSMAGISQFFSAVSGRASVLNIEKARDILQKHWVCDPDRIRREIGYAPRISVYEALQQTYDWYRTIRWL